MSGQRKRFENSQADSSVDFMAGSQLDVKTSRELNLIFVSARSITRPDPVSIQTTVMIAANPSQDMSILVIGTMWTQKLASF